MLEKFNKDVKEFLGEPPDELIMVPARAQITVNELKDHLTAMANRKISADDELLLELQGQIKLLKLRIEALEERVFPKELA